MIKRYWYAERNGYGLNLTLTSIGWQVLRFKSRRERDSYVDDNEYRQDTGNRICRGIDYDRMKDHLGYGAVIWYTDDSDYAYEIGVKGYM